MMGVEQYKIILDLPSEQPTLAFDQYARAFQEVIEKSSPRFAIGILGGWGSGKTTLMQAIRELLDKDLVIPVWFTAWRYEKEEHLIIPLLDVVRESLLSWSEKHPDKRKIVQKTASTLGKAVKSLLAGSSLRFGVPAAVNMTLDAGKVLAENRRLNQEELDALLSRSVYHSSFRELSDAFEEFAKDDPKRRIVVFVDDLDRCLPEGALEVLESMKLFFDLPGFVFVVGLDQNIVERLIDSKYGKTVLKPAQEEIKTDPRTNEEEIKRDHHIRGSNYVKNSPYARTKFGTGQP
jgi:predicted KAP-like P-loop ATPase